MYKNFLKKILDTIAASILLILLLPLVLILLIILSILNNGNPLYTQERVGKGNRIFLLYKFKSMNDKVDSLGKLLPDNERITRIGLIIRKTSLDELPQLINVIMGEMSLVGPRPLPLKYLPLYNKDQQKRHEVRPGITGLAQVNGRNSISWKEKFIFDCYYVENVSFFLDVKILMKTVVKVFKREGVNQSETRPMMPFNGNN